MDTSSVNSFQGKSFRELYFLSKGPVLLSASLKESYVSVKMFIVAKQYNMLYKNTKGSVNSNIQ